jgi:hypothetical protein
MPKCSKFLTLFLIGTLVTIFLTNSQSEFKSISTAFTSLHYNDLQKSSHKYELSFSFNANSVVSFLKISISVSLET